MNKGLKIDNKYFKIQNFLDISNDIYYFLNNPFLNFKKKYLFLYIIFNFEFLSSQLIKLIHFILNKKKSDINLIFNRLWYKKKNWVQLNVITAIPLNSYIEEYILFYLKKSYNNIKFFLKKKVNNSIIGGLILHFEDKEWNNSFKENLRKLKIHLKNYI